MQADRNLLHALAAIRGGCTDSAGLITACAECESGSQLTRMLVDRCGLTRSQVNQIERDVEQLIQEHGGDERAALVATLDTTAKSGELPPRGAETVLLDSLPAPVQRPNVEQTEHTLADKAQATITDQTIEGVMPAMSAPYSHDGTLSFDATVDAVGAPSEALQRLSATDSRPRYSLTRVHGSGGLGQVWLAIDRQLNRQVALKEMRPDRGASQQALRRLVKEAQITGQLEHPNIVPVYELAGSPEGQDLFYTMRFLRGETLKEAIDRYHENSGKPVAGSTQLRHLLQAFVGICNAMAYAGSKGIVHRDLKPQNIMMGSFGEVIVLDWGLAKKVDDPEEDFTSPAIATTDDADTINTLEGQVLGTPGYLSPEQARGDVKSIDPRTDVYGLGAILFAILTGQPPHRLDAGSTQGTRALVKAIIEGATPEAKSINPGTPAALNAVCLKAMASTPEDRYDSASELAEDVLRWIADEPVSVYVEPWGVRLARWTRRHRTWAQAAAITLLVAASVSTVAALVVNGARHRVEIARHEAEQAWQEELAARQAEAAAKADATRRFHDAQETVHRSLTGVSKTLLNFPGVERLRSELLEQAALDLERFAAEDSQDRELQLEAGRAIIRLGDVRGLLSQWDSAREQYLRAAAHFTRLQQQAPEDLAIQLEMANCRKQLAFSLATLGRDEEASRAYAEVLSDFGDLIKHAPDSTAYRLAQAAAFVDVAQYQDGVGDSLSAIGTLEQALAVFKRLIEQENLQTHQQGLAAAQRLHGQILGRIGRAAEAIEKLQQAIAGFQELQILDPSQPDYVADLADCRINLANTLLTIGRERESLVLYLAAISDYELLLKARPGVPQYRESMALLRRNVAQQLQRDGRNREGYDHAIEALREFTELVADAPRIPRYHAGEAASSLTFGRVLRDLNEDTLAQAAFDKAINKYGELVVAYPEYKTNLAISNSDLGRLLQKLGQPELARRAFEKSVKILEASVAESDTYGQDALAWSYTRLADVLYELGETGASAESYEKCLTIRSGLTQQPAHLYNLAWFLTHCRDLSRRDPERAAEIAGKLIAMVPENADYQNLLGVAQFRAERWNEALESLEEASRKRGHDNVSDGFYLAMSYWHQGNQPEARSTFQAAAQVMEREQPGSIDLIQLRSEASELIDLPEPTESPKSD